MTWMLLVQGPHWEPTELGGLEWDHGSGFFKLLGNCNMWPKLRSLGKENC